MFEDTQRGAVTDLLLRWSTGEQEALAELMPLVHANLVRLAAGYLRRERPGHTLQTQALVNEAFLSMVQQNRARWNDRAHFFAIAAQAMRRILVDHARRKGSRKHGGGLRIESLRGGEQGGAERSVDLLALDEALEVLARHAPQRARMVVLRFFGGLNKEEIAEVLKISPATVSRWWKVCRVWLYSYVVEGKRIEL